MEASEERNATVPLGAGVLLVLLVLAEDELVTLLTLIVTLDEELFPAASVAVAVTTCDPFAAPVELQVTE